MVNNRKWLVMVLLGCFLLPAVAEARQDEAAIVIDANSGAVLHAADADAARYPASLTKMMTIYLVFEHLRAGRLTMASRVRFSENAAGQPPSALGLAAGETLSIEEALRALITKSANDVAVAVAEHIAGTERAFANRMTVKARALGMHRTTFRNASGLPDDAQVSTARDMATLGLALQDTFPAYYRMFGERQFTYNSKRYRNHNRLLGRFRGTDGIKTGYTRASGFNIASSVRRDGKHLVGVVLGYRSGRARDTAMQSLLTGAFKRATALRTRPRGGRPLLLARPIVAPAPIIARPPEPRTRPSLDTERRPLDRPAATILTRAAPVTATPARNIRPPSTLGEQAVRLASGHQPGHQTGHEAAPQSHRSPQDARLATPARTTPSSHQIQVGAFFSETEAHQALVIAQTRAGAVLRGYQPLSVKLPALPRPVFRARFAGFDGKSAEQTCARLKTLRVDCFVARSN